MTKNEKARNYFKELEKLIKKCPKSHFLVYDVDKGLYMIPRESDFDHGEHGTAPAILCSVGMNYRPTKSETDGYMKIVSDPISQKYVELAAVSCNAEVVF